jgi:hypothetical protein
MEGLVWDVSRATPSHATPASQAVCAWVSFQQGGCSLKAAGLLCPPWWYT